MDKEIKRLLASKLEKLENIFNSTQHISHTLEKGDTEELLKLLSSRQQLMEDIDFIDSQLLSLFEEDINALIKYINDGNLELKVTHNSITALLKKTHELDNKNAIDVRELFSEIKNNIGNLKQAENALKGYGIIGKVPRDGAFIDTKK